MSFDAYQGDPKVFIDEDGAYLIFRNGQPVMDAGVENATIMSLLTEEDPNWYGNILVEKNEEKIGSNSKEL